jgi:hypothetical protein
MHPVLDQLDAVLLDCVPREPVEFAGEWRERSRRTYQPETQHGTGSGPFTDVVDLRWRGALAGIAPIGGIAFLLAGERLYWAKTPEISPSLPVDLSLHAYADHLTGRATFTASVGGAYLPGVAVSVDGALEDACHIDLAGVTTGRVARLAQAPSASAFVVLFPRTLLTVGRKRLWRVRDELVSTLPPAVRELLTHRRSGDITA